MSDSRSGLWLLPSLSAGGTTSCPIECWRVWWRIGVWIHVSSGGNAGAGLGSARELTPFMCA